MGLFISWEAFSISIIIVKFYWIININTLVVRMPKSTWVPFMARTPEYAQGQRHILSCSEYIFSQLNLILTFAEEAKNMKVHTNCLKQCACWLFLMIKCKLLSSLFCFKQIWMRCVMLQVLLFFISIVIIDIVIVTASVVQTLMELKGNVLQYAF